MSNENQTLNEQEWNFLLHSTSMSNENQTLNEQEWEKHTFIPISSTMKDNRSIYKQ